VALKHWAAPPLRAPNSALATRWRRTYEAVNLTTLFDGFRPLFQTLTPSDVNKLSLEIIKVFQGEGGTITELLSTPRT